MVTVTTGKRGYRGITTVMGRETAVMPQYGQISRGNTMGTGTQITVILR